MSYVSDRTLSQAKQIIQRGGSLDTALKYLQQGGSLERWLAMEDAYDLVLTSAQRSELHNVYAETMAVELSLETLAEFRDAYARDVEEGEASYESEGNDGTGGPHFSVAVEAYFGEHELNTDMDLMKSWVVEGAIIDRLGIRPQPAEVAMRG